MSLVVLLPAVVVLVGAVCAGIALGRLLDEASQLRTELERARRLQPRLAEVGTEAQRLRLVLARLRDRH